MTENSKKHIDACRFCWMCRHICPIGNATGLERNTSRARALGLSLVNREAYGIEEVVDNVYECACCGACTKECVTGWDPVMFTKEARLDAAMEGKLPEYINVLVDNCLATGNAYGATEIDADLKAAIAAHAAKTDTLLFLGVDAMYKVPGAAINAIKVLEKAGVAFTVLENEPASGQQLEYLISAANETKEQMTACAKVIGAYKTVVAFDPQDAKVFKREYKEWGVELACDVKTFTAYVAELLDAGKLTAKNTGKAVVFQDPFQLARDLKETEEPRKVVAAYATLNEMLCHGKDTMWAGNILMAQWMPEVIKKVADGRIFNAKGVKADTIVTASVSEYAALKSVDQNEVAIISLEELILG
ncbi:MAG: (Fe-S)-binding protein [Clostridia bacterium]|nr:(Fe-S)-binding protein [Clostridia bacterium]